MARTVAELPAGTRISDYISLGVIAKTFPAAAVEAALKQTGKTSMRQRELPAHVVVYYVISLALYMQSSYREVLRCLLEGIKWLMGSGAIVKVTGKSGISQARTRLGWEPVRHLHDEIVRPIAVESTRGAWSVWTEVRWTLLTKKETRRHLEDRLQVEAVAPFRSNPGLLPWAWGVNGFFSVIGASGAALIAVSWGFTVVIWTAFALYAMAAIVFQRSFFSLYNPTP